MSISYRELKRRYELEGPQKTVTHLSEALAGGELRPADFSLRDLAETLIPDGVQWVRAGDPRQRDGALVESLSAVDTTAFTNIAGQLVQRQLLDAYQHESFVLAKLVNVIPSRAESEKIPGITGIAGNLHPVGPGMPYPHLGFGEDYIETPKVEKRGFIVPVTREAIYYDHTHLVLQRAAEVGEVLALNKEQRLADVIIGAVNNYKSNGQALNTYYTGTPWHNRLDDNPLIDWTSVDRAEQLFNNLLDPHTGEPVVLRGLQALVTPALRHTAQRIFHATTIDYTVGGSTTTAHNPLGNYRVSESRSMYRRLLAQTDNETVAGKTWFLGDFSRAFAYVQNWPITVTQSAAQSEAEFSQDIVVRFKAFECGAAAVLNPRYVVRCTDV